MATAVNAQREAPSDMSEEEWEARQQLAACYRVFDMMGWSESIYNHITVKVPGEQNAFLGGHGSTPLFLSCVHHGHSDAGSQCLFCLSGRKTLCRI